MTVSAVQPLRSPPMTPPIDFGAVLRRRPASRSRRRRSSCRRARARCSPGRARRTVIAPWTLSASKTWSGRLRSIGHEVGDVDERRDRPQPDRPQPVLQPLRRRAVADAADQPADEERAGLAGDVGREVDADRAGEGARHRLDRRGLQRAEAAGGEVAGDAGDAERVGPVRGDRDVDHRVEGDDVDVAGADRRVAERARRCRCGRRRAPSRARRASCRGSRRRGSCRP